ncbi:NitT/TauT family transport system permease protein [Variovorax paradoxus]|jgi:NitT/TauT family transport system permease protein|uniref:ABC transporter permease n=1 Tax=Variovorax paradoxus TaxID=34073 RepID=UPI0033994598
MTSITEPAVPAAVPMDAADVAPSEAMLRAHEDRLRRRESMLRIVVPAGIVLALLLAWEWMVRANNIPHYILPAPSLILRTLFDNWASLSSALWFTVKLTLLALGAAIVGGVLLAIAFALFKWVEIGLFPIAVILQVTPIIAIAPLILIYVSSTTAALLLCAWIVAFFPILSNTVVGLKSADSNLRDLFQLYKASPWQTFRYLLAPSALPYFMAGLKIAGGLSLIGAVVAEFTAGTAGKETGLASRILESSFRTEIPMMFAALLLVSLLGIVIFIVFAALSRLVLGHWHESEMRRER